MGHTETQMQILMRMNENCTLGKPAFSFDKAIFIIIWPRSNSEEPSSVSLCHSMMNPSFSFSVGDLPSNGRPFHAWCLLMLLTQARLKTRRHPYLLARKRQAVKRPGLTELPSGFSVVKEQQNDSRPSALCIRVALQPKHTIWRVGRCKSMLFIGLAVCRSLQVSMNNVHASGCIFSWNYIVKE